MTGMGGVESTQRAFGRPEVQGQSQAAGSAWSVAVKLRNALREYRGLLPEFLAITVLLAVIWVSIGFILSREHAHELDAARSANDALARAYAESTARIISSIDLTLLSARDSYKAAEDKFDLQKWSDRVMQDDRLRVQLAIVDANGNSVTSTLARSNERAVYVGDRLHFLFQKNAHSDDLFISEPVLGRATNRETIQFTRKIMTTSGKFDGILVLSLSCEEWSQFYDLSRADEGSVIVTNADGVVLAGRSREVKVGETVPVAPKAATYAPGEAPIMIGELAVDDGQGGLVSQLKLGRYPIVVIVHRSAASIFRAYDHARTYYQAIGAIATFVVLLIGVFWLVQRRRVILQGNALSATLAGVSQGIVMVNADGALAVSNLQARHILAVPDGLPSSDITRAFLRLYNSPRVAEPLAEEMPEVPSFEVSTDDGRIVEIRGNGLQAGGTVYTLTDVTEQHRAQSRIRFLAQHDVLTGLPNRVLLEQRLALILEHAAQTKARVLVMFIDLDSFKSVNDTLGHLFGDKLLRQVADVIRTSVSSTDFVARLGGDEFVVVHPTHAQDDTGDALAQTLIENISRPIVINLHETRVGASIGIACYPDHGLDHHELFKKADIALYKVKGAGRAAWQYFVSGMDEHLQRRHLLEESLRAALENGALDVHYQAQFDVSTRRIRGFEALARWQHPVHGWVEPRVFIAIAEECGLIGRLGTWVLERACEAAALWPKGICVSVNVSMIQLCDVNFVSHVKKILDRTSLSADQLELELTESLMMGSDARVIEMLHALRGIGVRLALDDFGTGYSCLSNLLRFHFDKIKIERSFVHEQLHDPNARAILEAVMAIGRNIGIDIVASGVETADQEAMLVRQGCPIIQGYHIAEPLNAEHVMHLLMPETNT